MQYELPTLRAEGFLKKHDLPGLHTVIGVVHGKIGTKKAQRWLRVSVLANAYHKDARWFWSETLGERAETVFETMTKVALKRLKGVEVFASTDDYCVSTAADELPVMLVSPEVKHYLLDSLPVERHGSLNALMRLNNDVTHELQRKF
jgi:hypothetical protein